MYTRARNYIPWFLAILLVVAGVTYLQAPVFWQRYINTFRSAGAGADSPVFDVKAMVPASTNASILPIAAEPGLTAKTRDDLVTYAQRFDSFALLVVHQGEMELEWYADEYSRDSLTQSQSMHKSIQALLVGIAVDKGLIASIDDPLSDYLPAAVNIKGTVRDFLQMSTGLKPFDGGFSPFGEAFRWLYAEDLIESTLAIPQPGNPGVEFEYHDGNSQLLGMMLSEVFGATYPTYLYEQVWDPIGAGEALVWLDQPGGTPHHNCCLLARAIDWARVGLLFLNGGEYKGERVVSSSWIDEQASPALTPHYGFQTWLASNVEANPREGGGGYGRSENWLADDVFFFSGYGAQRVYVSRSKELVIVRLGPAAGYFPKIAAEWDNTFLVNTVVRDLGID